MHDKVDRSTSLCELLFSIKDHVKNEEHFEKFEIERNALPTVGMPMLNTRFFGQIDANIKDFLTSTMLGKQRSQMNQSVCYDVNRITEWQRLIKVSKFVLLCNFVINDYISIISYRQKLIMKKWMLELGNRNKMHGKFFFDH